MFPRLTGGGGHFWPPPVNQRSIRAQSAVDVLDLAVQAVRLIVYSGGEEQRTQFAAVAAVTEAQPPQAVDHDRSAGLALQLPAEPSVKRERVDPAVAEIADEDVVVKVAEGTMAGGKVRVGIPDSHLARAAEKNRRSSCRRRRSRALDL